MSSFLFDKGPTQPTPSDVAEELKGTPRLRKPVRNQIEVHWSSLDDLLEETHPARMVWAAVCGLDLGSWLKEIKAVEGHVGRNATDPRLLVALWVLATLDGVGSARALAELCTKHIAYQWLCGGVSLNYHTLSSFRSSGGDKWDDLLTQIVGSLMAQQLVTLQRVSQDGMRVRASAGKSSFRREGRLKQCLAEAREQVKTLRKLSEESPSALDQRQQAARERAVKERARRVEEAIRNCQQLQKQRDATAKKSGRKPAEARASTTDPEARVMQFSDGGYRPGYNVQYATDTASGVVVGVDVTNAGTDMYQLPPMLDRLREKYGQVPAEALVDGGFASLEAIGTATEKGCVVYAPLKDEEKQLTAGKDPYVKKRGDSEAVAAWRSRMGTATAKQMYRLRAQTAEWVNANVRNMGFQQMRTRGREKCKITALIYAIAHNIVRSARLRVTASPPA